MPVLSGDNSPVQRNGKNATKTKSRIYKTKSRAATTEKIAAGDILFEQHKKAGGGRP
jgi:hypothetical protein